MSAGQVHERLEYFIEYFVDNFELKLQAYHISKKEWLKKLVNFQTHFLEK